MPVRWGIIGCGDVTEVKSGPAFQRADGSTLVAVMRRDRAKADDYARRHGVGRAYDRAADLVDDADVDAIYIATPPSTHLELARLAARAGKPCLVEKPMAMDHRQCVEMVAEFRDRRVPLWVAYYRRALPRFLAVRERLGSGVIGEITAVHVEVTDRVATGATLANWRFDPAVAGAGLFFDLGSHCFDLLDFLCGPIAEVHGVSLNTARAYTSEDVVAAAFRFERGPA
jgi:1,5-anhydro-D-fructose reductase (1,5-anhydro-D-mannitol-forming)